MIERNIVAQRFKEKEIEEFVFSFLGNTSCSRVELQRTPMGDKVSVHTSRPGVIVGRKGANIKAITEELKKRYGMDNPQVEVVEIQTPALDAASVARRIISGLQRFGTKRFKVLAYGALEESMRAGAKGIEIVVSGRGLPGERAKTWRFSAGYLKKSGDISASFMDRCYESANIKTGTIGVKVSILGPHIKLPDYVVVKEPVLEKKIEIKEEVSEEKVEKKASKKKKSVDEAPKEEVKNDGEDTKK